MKTSWLHCALLAWWPPPEPSPTFTCCLGTWPEPFKGPRASWALSEGGRPTRPGSRPQGCTHLRPRGAPPATARLVFWSLPPRPAPERPASSTGQSASPAHAALSIQPLGPAGVPPMRPSQRWLPAALHSDGPALSLRTGPASCTASRYPSPGPASGLLADPPCTWMSGAPRRPGLSRVLTAAAWTSAPSWRLGQAQSRPCSEV